MLSGVEEVTRSPVRIEALEQASPPTVLKMQLVKGESSDPQPAGKWEAQAGQGRRRPNWMLLLLLLVGIVSCIGVILLLLLRG